ncbi:hypothetical protein TYRP_015743 [Tyrophagus putrescentiae]|nr:hypothetical protein TYRP_015743 [Tyrophagus putrescentiae]
MTVMTITGAAFAVDVAVRMLMTHSEVGNGRQLIIIFGRVTLLLLSTLDEELEELEVLEVLLAASSLKPSSSSSSEMLYDTAEFALSRLGNQNGGGGGGKNRGHGLL